MLVVLKNGEIELTRGDSATFVIKITDDAEQLYSMSDDDTLTFSVKKNIRDPEPCIEKEIKGNNRIHLEPKDTAGLDYGNYVYDVELATAEGDVYTVIEKTPFEIREEVTTR